jgi:hypothetical protein
LKEELGDAGFSGRNLHKSFALRCVDTTSDRFLFNSNACSKRRWREIFGGSDKSLSRFLTLTNALDTVMRASVSETPVFATTPSTNVWKLLSNFLWQLQRSWPCDRVGESIATLLFRIKPSIGNLLQLRKF